MNDLNQMNGFEPADSLMREERAASAVKEARFAKSGVEAYWQRMRAYYDGTHDTARQTGGYLCDADLPWQPAGVPDGYLHVESAIDAKLPEFTFSARGEADSKKATLREKVVRYVLQNGDVYEKNAVNERRLNLYGSAVWKLGITKNERDDAEITVENPTLETVYPDPFATTVSECEYVAFVYHMSRTRAERIFREDLLRRDLTMQMLFSDNVRGKRVGGLGDTVEITEFWFRQPTDGEEICDFSGEKVSYTAGDIALSILVEGREVRYLPKFWKKTSFKEYPFVIYEKIPTDGRIWGKSELETIIPLIDAADRQLFFAQLNTAFFAGDILVYEENAFAPDSFPENRPGAIWKLRPGMMEKVKRLGGLAADGVSHYEIAEKYRAMMKEATGNYDFMQGDSSTRVNTATGLALLGDYATKRQEAKNMGKRAGFEALYRLIDQMALEIFSVEKLHEITDEDISAEMLSYMPSPDVSVTVCEGVEGTRSYVLSALTDLFKTEITQENYPIVRAYVGALGFPERHKLLEALDARFMPMDEERSK